MKRIILLIFISIFFCDNLKSQSNDFEAATYNIGFGSIFGTIGAIINKKPNEKLGKTVLKGLTQGALGGYLTFESKRLLGTAKYDLAWEKVWASKLLNSAGNSIKQNAASNQNFWNNWYFDLGFNRLEFNLNDKFKVNYKLMPITFGYTIDAFFRYGFDSNTSLRTGQFVFYGYDFKDYSAYATTGHIVYDKLKEENPLYSQSQKYQTMVHEIIHLYQNEDFMVLNNYYQKSINKWAENNKTVNKLNKFIYLDLHYIPKRIIYGIEYNNSLLYYDNFFEHEAGYYSNTIDKTLSLKTIR